MQTRKQKATSLCHEPLASVEGKLLVNVSWEKKPEQQLLYLICMVVSQVVMCWQDGCSPHSHPLLAAVHTYSNIAAVMTNRLLIPSCLPLPHPMSCSALGGTSSRKFCNFLSILPVEKWQPARCRHIFYFCTSLCLSERCRRLSCFEKPSLKAMLLGLAWQRRVCWQLSVRAGWQDREPLGALLAKFSPLRYAPAVARRARPAHPLSEEGKLLGAKSQLQEAKRAGAGGCGAAKRCSRA